MRTPDRLVFRAGPGHVYLRIGGYGWPRFAVTYDTRMCHGNYIERVGVKWYHGIEAKCGNLRVSLMRGWSR